MTEPRKAPDRIYLQWFGADTQDLTPEERNEPAPRGEVSWCQDKIYDTDIEYVRAK